MGDPRPSGEGAGVGARSTYHDGPTGAGGCQAFGQAVQNWAGSRAILHAAS
jgi:hypothetical protein